MFDLEREIATWRRQLARVGIKSVECVAELESHLRDEFEAQITSGANPEDAFQRAVAAVGSAAELNAEFTKIASTTHRMGKCLQASYLLASVFMLAVNAWTLLEYELSSLARTLGISAVVLISIYLASLPRWVQWVSPSSFTRFAGIIKVGANLVWIWPLWALLQAEHVIGVEIGILPTVFIWSFYAAIVLTIVAFRLTHGSRPGDAGGWIPPSSAIPQPIPPTPVCPPELSLPGSKPVDPTIHRALEFASGEASRLGHGYIGTEHLLLGILKEAKGTLANVLRQIHIDYDAVQTELSRLITPVPASASPGRIPLTPRAQKALKFGAREAKAMHQATVGAEHVFLGLLLEGHGLGAQALRNLGVDVKTTRAQLIRALAFRVR